MGMMVMQMQQPCTKCNGKGKTHAHVCPICGGKRTVQEKKKFEVDITKGMANNEQIVFEK